jgi:hypothetical protein
LTGLSIVAEVDIARSRIAIFDNFPNARVRSYIVRGRVLQRAQEGEVRVFARVDIIVTFDHIEHFVDVGVGLNYLTANLPIFNGEVIEDQIMGVFAETGAGNRSWQLQIMLRHNEKLNTRTSSLSDQTIKYINL